MSGRNLKLYSICYDEETSKSIPSGMMPLQNTDGPSWLFEVHPIHHYFTQNQVNDNEWLGFFSPKFKKKTNLTTSHIARMFDENRDNFDACLFTSHFDQAAISLNVWLQGDALHPGLLAISQKLASLSGYKIDLKAKINSLNETVFSHYLIANGKFWREWYRVVSVYFKMMESDPELFKTVTPHQSKLIPIHPFIIERVPTLVLNSEDFSSTFDFSLYRKQIPDSSSKYIHLRTIDHCKKMFAISRDTSWLIRYQKLLNEYQKIISAENGQTFEKIKSEKANPNLSF